MLGYRRNVSNLINTQLNINELANSVDTSFADVYTKSYINTSFADVYTKSYIDTSFADVYTLIQDIDTTAILVNNVRQTFYEICTQQPYKFDRTSINIYTTSIILRWNYDSIIPRHLNNNIAKLANIFDYKQNLPFIDRINIDICQNNLNNLDWINIATLTISGDYNVDNFKQHTFERMATNSIIDNNMPFSIRVYGINYSNDYPSIQSRSLVFSDLTFLPVNPPSQPLFVQSSVSNRNSITLTYFNTLTDYLDSNSSAIVTNYIIDYSLNNTLASNSLVRNLLANIQNSITENFANNINSNSEFVITITNLMSGAQYNHSVKVKNIFSNIYSQYSTISGSKYTLLPSNNNIGTSIDISINTQCYKNISTSNLDNLSILYFNIANTSDSFMFDNSYSQAFQITHPEFTNQQLTTYGYGKYVDNSANLVTISLRINNVQKHLINYGGYNTSNNNYNYSKTDYNNNKDFILNNTTTNTTTNDIRDIYDASINMGFRLKGYLLLKDIITNENMIDYFGDPSTNPYIMDFIYQRHVDVSSSYNINNSYNIYIDRLDTNPIISNITNAILIQDVKYNMSIASVRYFKLLLTRRYSNINSIYKYIVGNRIIANFSSAYTSITTSFTQENITLAQSEIVANGIYNYDLSYNNIAYLQQVKSDYSFNILETAYNLKGNTTNNISLISKPYCDYNSFNKLNNIIDSNKLNLNTLLVYEISNIQLMGSDLSNIQLTRYTNHSNQILPSTLLYLNSSFSNVFQSYPNSNDFSYNSDVNLNISYNTHGSTSYDLSGNISITNQGYKWIVFKIPKTSDGRGYLFNTTSYSTIMSNNNPTYLPLKTMLGDLFSSSILDNIFDVANNDALMFGHATPNLSTEKKYFNIKQRFAPSNIWTVNSFSNNISYNTTTSLQIFGSNVSIDGSPIGLYCLIDSLKDDLTIYIGLKKALSY